MRTVAKSLLLLLGVLLFISASASPDREGVIADSPSASPDGREFVFSADPDGTARLWVGRMEGGRPRLLSKTTDAHVSELDPAWSPTGRHIAYVAVRNGVSDIWIIRSDGSNPRQLTHHAGNNRSPAWSPDGKRIIFVSDRKGVLDIWTMHPDGSGVARVTQLRNADADSPGFSPDGGSIVYSLWAERVGRVIVASGDGSRKTSLAPGNFRDWEPAWGRGGIVFGSDRDRSGGWKLWLVQPDGSGLRQLGGVAGHDAAWTPDGRILFSDERAGGPGVLSTISVLDPATGKVRPLVDW